MRRKSMRWGIPLLALVVLAATFLYLKSVGFGNLLKDQISTRPAAEADTAVLLTPAQMKADLDELTATIAEVHPKLLNGWTAEEQTSIREAYESVQQPRTAEQFYFIANGIAMLLHDGHTSLGIQPLVTTYLDLPLFWTRDGLTLTADRGELHTGDIVTAIGGRSVGELEQELAQLIPAENMIWVRAYGTSYLRMDAVLQHLGLIENGQVVVEVVRGTQTLSEPVALKGRYDKGFDPYTAYNADFTYVIEDDPPLAVLQINSCNYNANYKKLVKQFFEEVSAKGIRHIAVDVRSNSGGNSAVIDEFLSYVHVDSYRGFSSLVRFSPQLQAVNGMEQDSGYEEYHNGPIQNVLKTDQPYDGKLYILTSPRTFSSANWFAAIVQDNDLGTILGEATGNRPTSYGNILTFTLPSSGIPYQVSYCSWKRPDPARDPADSILPDIEAYTTKQDIAEHKDTQMEKLREVVRADLAAGSADN